MMKLIAKSSNTAIDPVCGMQVDPCATDLVAEYKDRTFYFCADGCLRLVSVLFCGSWPDSFST